MEDLIQEQEQQIRGERDNMPGIIATLGELQSGAIITEDGVANLFGRHAISVKRAVQRGELPQPVKLFGQNTWTVGALLRHTEMRLKEAQEAANTTTQRIAALSP
jgi:hypothetical protein